MTQDQQGRGRTRVNQGIIEKARLALAVAAGALVLEDVPPFTVVGGVPAQVLKEFDPDEMALR